MEQLKERYYEMCRSLLHARAGSAEPGRLPPPASGEQSGPRSKRDRGRGAPAVGGLWRPPARAEGRGRTDELVRALEAERLAEESKVAAELASAATETSKALESNQELSRGVQALIDEMRRTGGQQ